MMESMEDDDENDDVAMISVLASPKFPADRTRSALSSKDPNQGKVGLTGRGTDMSTRV
jgi:hypothetical protein